MLQILEINLSIVVLDKLFFMMLSLHLGGIIPFCDNLVGKDPIEATVCLCYCARMVILARKDKAFILRWERHLFYWETGGFLVTVAPSLGRKGIEG